MLTKTVFRQYDPAMDLNNKNLLLVGFLIITVISGWLTFKQARVVDAAGDVAALRAEMRNLQMEIYELQSNDGDAKEIASIKDEIKELKKEIPEQANDVQNAMAALPNGAIIWTLLLQVGSAAFGVGLIKLLQNKEENERLRSTALLILGFIVIYFIAGKFSYLVSGAGGSAGGMGL